MTANINNRVYDELAESWWDENEFLHLLKAMVNPWRVPYFENILRKQYGRNLTQVRLLDIGTGGGSISKIGER